MWRAAVGFVGYHYLINFAPLVAPGITTRIAHVRSQTDRYAGAFAPPGAAPPPPLWRLNNPWLAKLIFINNYGVHKHNFKATPVAYVWDWLELAAPIAGAGCITINGVFMCWVRLPHPPPHHSPNETLSISLTLTLPPTLSLTLSLCLTLSLNLTLTLTLTLTNLNPNLNPNQVRGTTAQIEKGPFADKLGAPRRLSQNTTWFTAMGGA